MSFWHSAHKIENFMGRMPYGGAEHTALAYQIIANIKSYQ